MESNELRNYQKRYSKYEKDVVIVRAVVSRIEFINKEIKDKYKSVFYCPSYVAPEGRRCIYWGRISLEVGDEVEMKGRFIDGAFLVWSIKRYRS